MQVINIILAVAIVLQTASLVASTSNLRGEERRPIHRLLSIFGSESDSGSEDSDSDSGSESSTDSDDEVSVVLEIQIHLL